MVWDGWMDGCAIYAVEKKPSCHKVNLGKFHTDDSGDNGCAAFPPWMGKAHVLWVVTPPGKARRLRRVCVTSLLLPTTPFPAEDAGAVGKTADRVQRPFLPSSLLAPAQPHHRPGHPADTDIRAATLGGPPSWIIKTLKSTPPVASCVSDLFIIHSQQQNFQHTQ